MTTESHDDTSSWWSKRSTFQKVLMIGGGVLVALMVVGAATSDQDVGSQDTATDATGSDEPSGTETTSTSPGVPGIGDTVRDGQFEFVVTGVEQPGSTYQPDLVEDEATGEWFLVHLTVENIGTEARTFYSGIQVVTWDGREYKGSDFNWNVKNVLDLNPGLRGETAIMFDVPPGFPQSGDGTVLVLHDSAFSGGTEVGF